MGQRNGKEIMPGAHRNGDLRVCSATTVVQNQGSVYVNGRLWAVEGSENSHTGGGLIPSGHTVFCEGKKVIVHAPDHAVPDASCPIPATHCDPMTAEGSADVFAYGK